MVTPKTLAQAHEVLEAQLSPKTLREIDAMKTEGDMIAFHHGQGRSMRNDWGLWGGSPLFTHMQSLGFTHPDDMSSVILATFWCKRHKKPFRLEERAKKYKLYWLSLKPPTEEIKDPRDGSAVKWRKDFTLTMEGDMHHSIHVGQSRTTGQWIAYTYTKGAYVPDETLLARIKSAASK